MLTIIGAILFIVGVTVAYYFYNFNLGLFTVTIWKDAIIFGTIATVGLVMLIFGFGNFIHCRNQKS